MQLNEQQLTVAHRDKLKALVATYREGTKADKISSTQQAAVYANAHYLLFDTICATCEKADKLMQYLLTYFADEPQIENDVTIETVTTNKKKAKAQPKPDENNTNQ